jgi:hypothetical protein
LEIGMTKANGQRRANLARSLARHREGRPLASPHWGRRFDAWREGMRQAVRVGKRSHHDLDRGHERIPATGERQYRCASATFAPPELPARQARWGWRPGQKHDPAKAA